MNSIAGYVLGFACLFATLTASAQSFYPARLDDANAVYLSTKADGKTDISAALQQAIDKVRAEHGEGVLFIPEGRYRLARTIYVWPGVRLIGYGKQRPVFVLGDNTPGYQRGLGYMFVFAGGPAGKPRPQPLAGTVPLNNTIPDANPGTFYSAMSNIDFEMGRGNPAALAIRFHVAQHCFLTHMNFHIDSGLAALKDIGNEAEDLHFYGGHFGILTEKPSPGWQFTLLDSSFEGQSVAAIQEHEAGLTLIHDTFRSVPAAVSIDPGYPDELYIRDSTFDTISGAAVTISNENSPRTEIHLHNLICRNVPLLAKFRESGKQVAGPAEIYRVRAFSHGLKIQQPGHEGAIRTRLDAEPLPSVPAPTPAAIRSYPPENTWVNLKSLGAKGDNTTDDTAAIQRAIATNKAIYVPTGRYLVTSTIKLGPQTALIGLDPSTTQFDLPDGAPAFQGPGSPQPLMESPPNGETVLSGIGLYTNGINSRAVGLLWRAGRNSLVDDVRFLGGHGTNAADGHRINPYNNTHTADPDPHRRWDAQFPSLWVTDGGGGTFADIWTPDTYAQAGLYISNTTTPGFVYELSSEHHVRNEVKIVNASHWELDALQTEEERGESAFALPLSIDRSSDITIANYHSYRVVSSNQPFRAAIEVHDSRDIHFRNLHVDSDSKAAFDNTVLQQPYGAEVRDNELASLTINDAKPEPATPQPPPTIAAGAKLEKLASGFFNASGVAADSAGNLYFVDAHRQQILRWAPATKDLTIVRDSPLDPVNLAIDKAGNLLVISYGGKGVVYAFRPDAPLDRLTVLKPVPAVPRPSMTPWLAADYFVYGAFDRGIVPHNTWQYVALDRSLFIAADSDFVNGALYYGTKMAPVLRSFSLTPAEPGRPFYVTDESQERTYRTAVDATGALGKSKLFAERGGESVTQDSAGNVYLAAGQIYVYSQSGKLLGEIPVPARPIDLVFGGADRRTLFVFTHSALYAIRTNSDGVPMQ